MPDATAPPRSILKHTSPRAPLPSNLPRPKTDAEKRRLDLAIQHATLIQDQKRTQQQNLDAIEELSDYPLGPVPSTHEITRFTSLVALFQPSDYDALIEERHANGRCGYTLCARPARTLDAKRSWLRSKGAQNWCSDECAKRALYVKAQLDETPAWERRGDAGSSIVLRSASNESVEAPLLERRAMDQDDLAMERGEKVYSSKVDRVTTDVVEKTSRSAGAPAVVRFDDLAHQDIEGYRVSGSGVKLPIRHKT